MDESENLEVLSEHSYENLVDSDEELNDEKNQSTLINLDFA